MSSKYIELFVVVGIIGFSAQYLFDRPAEDDELPESSNSSSSSVVECEADQILPVPGIIDPTDTNEAANFKQVYDNKYPFTINDPNDFTYCSDPGSVLQKIDNCGYICSRRSGRFEVFGTNFDSDPLTYVQRGTLNEGLIFPNRFTSIENTFINVDDSCKDARLDLIWKYDHESSAYDFPNTENCYNANYYNTLNKLNEDCATDRHCDLHLKCGVKDGMDKCLHEEFRECTRDDECINDSQCITSCETDVCSAHETKTSCVTVQNNMLHEKNGIHMTYFHSNDVYMNMFYNISLSSIQISGSDDTIDDDLFDVLVYTFNIRLVRSFF